MATSTGKVVKNTSANSDWTKTSKVTFTPAADGESGVIEISVSSVKAGYICALEIDTYEDGPGKTPTQLSWSAPTATVDLAGEAKEFPTLTKDPASITGITYTSNNADVATVNEATGEITLVACGQTTIKAAYAGDDTYASSSATYIYELWIIALPLVNTQSLSTTGFGQLTITEVSTLRKRASNCKDSKTALAFLLATSIQPMPMLMIMKLAHIAHT